MTFYYPPDLCAGSFRAEALVKALCDEAGSNLALEVVTTQPNRYNTYTSREAAYEESPGLTISRIDLPSHRSGFIDQALAFAHFARGVQRLTKARQYDLVVATSSRLMTAALGAWVARQRGARLYLDMRDIFVEIYQEVFPSLHMRPLTPIFSGLERWTLGRADKVNLVSEGFRSYFLASYPEMAFSLYTHGVDTEFMANSVIREAQLTPEEHPIRVVYAGNIGYGQGLHLILPELAKRLSGHVHFFIVGDGGRKDVLMKALSAAQVKNVELHHPMKRTDLLEVYSQADVLFLHLNDYQAFQRVLPSKLFEYASTGKPILAGLSGYASAFIVREISNAAIFTPCHVDGAVAALEKLDLRTIPRNNFVKRFARDKIMRDMARDILHVLG